MKEHHGLTTAELERQAAEFNLTSCQMALGYVVFDTVVLAIGAIGLRASVQPKTIAAMAKIAGPVATTIEQEIAIIAHESTDAFQQAKAVFNILLTLKNGGMLGAIFGAFRESLTWWQATLYAIGGLATIIAALATDGVAFAAGVVILLTSFAWLVTDSLHAISACSLETQQAPPEGNTTSPSPNPLPYLPQIVLMTAKGNFVKVVNNGGIENDDSGAFSSNRTVAKGYETYTVEVIDQDMHTFAIKTHDGKYVTAVDGGGQAGTGDTQWALTTDATAIGTEEVLVLAMQEDDSYALMTSDGYYITANHGGGQSYPGDPMRTNAKSIGPYETFSFQSIQNDGVTFQQALQGTAWVPVDITSLSVRDTANASHWSVRRNLQVGDMQYGDRSYELATIPNELLGATWIRTANSSKDYKSNPTVTFSIGRPASIYVSVDTRGSKPSWIDSSWEPTSLQITNHGESSTRTFNLYRKRFPRGSVSLGPNGNDKYDMYSVIAVG
ncbi:MAG: hypothetical protein AB1Z98_19160 [Nannocystaceae bacterium]